MRKASLRHFVFAGLIIAPGTARAADTRSETNYSGNGHDTWLVSTGVNYSDGDYGATARTRVTSAQLGARYRRGSFSIGVTVPFVHVEGPGNLLDTPLGGAGFGGGSADASDTGYDSAGSDDSASPGSDGVISPPNTPSRPRDGIGDVSARIGYALQLMNATVLDLSGRIKIPTASRTKGLGTGKTDLTLGGDLIQGFGKLSIHAGARRKFVGQPTGLVLKDSWAVGGGASYQLTGSTRLGADYDWRQSSIPGRTAGNELTGWLSFGIGKRLRMQAFGTKGLNEASTNFAAGIGLNLRVN